MTRWGLTKLLDVIDMIIKEPIPERDYPWYLKALADLPDHSYELVGLQILKMYSRTPTPAQIRKAAVQAGVRFQEPPGAQRERDEIEELTPKERLRARARYNVWLRVYTEGGIDALKAVSLEEQRRLVDEEVARLEQDPGRKGELRLSLGDSYRESLPRLEGHDGQGNREKDQDVGGEPEDTDLPF